MPGLFTVRLGFFLMGCTARLRRFLVRGIQACTFSDSFLSIAPDSSLVPTVSGRVRGLLAGGMRDGLLLEVIWLDTVGLMGLWYRVSFLA